MQHTYLRYECADAFGLISASAASKVPHSNSTLAFASNDPKCPIVLSSAGSHCTGFHLRTSNPTIKIGHRDDLRGGVGTGRALNSSQVVCIDVSTSSYDSSCRVATGWVDGAVRVFQVSFDELNAKTDSGMIHTLLSETDSDDNDFVMREPLVLNGHSGSPIRSISFDSKNKARLASGSGDGAVVLWDVVEETGLFRLLGHRAAITEVLFAHVDRSFDALITSSLDGLVKVWDLVNQCCVQTIASHRGKVWSSAFMTGSIILPDLVSSPADKDEGEEASHRARLITGDDDGMAKVWSVRAPRHFSRPTATTPAGSSEISILVEDSSDEDASNACSYMGALRLPSNIASPGDRIASLRVHPGGKYVGVCHANSKTVFVYVVRSAEETRRRKQRRLTRQRQKAKSAESNQENLSNPKEKKRGLLDDDEEENAAKDVTVEPTEAIDEFEFLGAAVASHKIKSFVFVPWEKSNKKVQLVCSLTTNAIEVVSLQKAKASHSPLESTKLSMINSLGHSTGIRAVELSSDDSLACSISKGCFKVWNVASRKCIQSVTSSDDGVSLYGLCAVFLPGNSHVLVGTRGGNILLLDIAAGDVSMAAEKAHNEAIWCMDLRRATDQQPRISIVTGSADKTVKFWDVEERDGAPAVAHSRTLEMSDDVVAVRYSHATDPSKRMIFVSSMDSTVKVFFDDTLKFFLSLYGHKLPALAVDASDDDTILATAGADKLVKIWGLDFGDTHKTLHGHEDSITDLRFVRRTHNFFTSSKDFTLRYWDGDRFEQILVLDGHFAEVSSLAISRTGAFLLSAGMDRQVRVWERTKDIVFLDEERELELERRFDRVDERVESGTGELLRRKAADGDDDEEAEPQSEAAIKQSVLSIAAGDRILAALETADLELKSSSSHKGQEKRSPNPLLLGMDPAAYVLWVLKSVKQAELEQSLLVLSLEHVSRMLYYLVISLRRGQGTETCSRVAVFLVTTHQHQIQANHWKLARALQELRRLLRLRLEESRSIVGFNLSGLREVHKNPSVRSADNDSEDFGNPKDKIWSGIALGNSSRPKQIGKIKMIGGNQ